MKPTFFFYDLETSGINPRDARIVQFAGQRTGLDLKPIGEPHNYLIKLSEDTLPEPDAVMITGITPQMTLQDGLTEAEFLKIFEAEIDVPDTIFAGFNSIRFDDEFMRFTRYRNFFDPYEWQWKDGRSRWDLLDVVRMTRALRPEGINWPFAPDGKPANRLELLTSVNKLSHEDAHDALSDVRATIAVAQMIRDKQPKLFGYLLDMRDKKAIKKLVDGSEPFLYVSGKYSADFEKLAVVHCLGPHPDKQGSLVYDLRHDPTQFLHMEPEELANIWRYNKDPDALRLPVKTLQYNRCPAVAPLGVLNDENKQRLQIDLDTHLEHQALLTKDKDFYLRLKSAIEILNSERSEQTTLVADEKSADAQLYDGFIGDADKRVSASVRSSKPENLSAFAGKLSDPRLKAILPLYKARNFPKSLNEDERKEWDDYRAQRLQKQLPKFMARLQSLAEQSNISKEQQYLIEELQLYAQSIVEIPS